MIQFKKAIQKAEHHLPLSKEILFKYKEKEMCAGIEASMWQVLLFPSFLPTAHFALLLLRRTGLDFPLLL